MNTFSEADPKEVYGDDEVEHIKACLSILEFSDIEITTNNTKFYISDSQYEKIKSAIVNILRDDYKRIEALE